MVRETAAMASALLHGERVRFGDFPVLCAFHHLLPDASMALAFPPQAPICFFSGANGPRMLAIAGARWTACCWRAVHQLRPARPPRRAAGARAGGGPGRAAPAAAAGDRRAERLGRPRSRARSRLPAQVRDARDGAPGAPGRDRRRSGAAGHRPRRHRAPGAGLAAGATVEEVARLVPDAMVDACFLAGRPEEVAEGLGPLLDAAAEQGVEQVACPSSAPTTRAPSTCSAGSSFPACSASHGRRPAFGWARDGSGLARPWTATPGETRGGGAAYLGGRGGEGQRFARPPTGVREPCAPPVRGQRPSGAAHRSGADREALAAGEESIWAAA